jgi:pyruvate kinase
LRSCSAHLITDIHDMDKAIDDCMANFTKSGLCQPGDAVVVVMKTVPQKGATSLMRVNYA